jgi:hypothetical protein
MKKSRPVLSTPGGFAHNGRHGSGSRSLFLTRSSTTSHSTNGLAQRDDLIIKVFYTWHVGHAAVEDRGFKTPVAWDIPLTEGYEFELIQNGGHPSFFWP